MMNNLYKLFAASNLGFYLIIIAAVGDLLIPFLLAPFCSKYSHMTMVMSSLGNSSNSIHIIYNVWLILAGIMLILGNIKLFLTYSHIIKSLSIWLFVIILIYAVGGCILSGIFPVGETKELLTISQRIHGYGAVLGFFLLTFAPLVIGILSIRAENIAIGVISLIFFLLSLIFFSLFVMADKESFAHTIISYEGLWQRLSLLCMYAPIVIISFKNLS